MATLREEASAAHCPWCHEPLWRVWVDEAPDPWWCRTPACHHRQEQYAVFRRSIDAKGTPVGPLHYLYVPTPVQVEWHDAVYQRTTTRLLVGGQAGPGKSRWLRETLYQLAMQVPGFHGLLLRRTHQDLNQSHVRFVPSEVALRGGVWKIGDRVVEFPHPGKATSLIRMGHLEDAGALQNYLSSEYDAIAPDELVTFDRDEMIELFTRARSSNPALFALRGLTYQDEGRTKRLDGSLVVTATNPGGKGARWVKDFFIDKTPDRETFTHYRSERWAFKSAALSDNPYIEEGYRDTLEDLPPLRRRQLLEGDWDAYEGQFFGEWQETRDGKPWHVVERTIRPEVEWFGAMDWGYNAPGYMAWVACLPDGHYHVAQEYKFQQTAAETVGQQIRAVTEAMGITRLRYIACDPSMKHKTGHGRGESILETLSRLRLPMRASDNDRNNGWLRMHQMLQPAPDGRPWLTVDPSCRYLRRTLPAMQQDTHDPEDLDTTQDDHAVDALRYGLMSRPGPTRITIAPRVLTGTLGAMVADLRESWTRKSVLGADCA